MEKISGILASSPRLKSTDLQSSPPVRPGAPSFGRPVGEVSLAHRKDLTTAQKANMIREQMIEDKKRLKELDMVENLSEKFFMNQVEQRAIEASPSAEEFHESMQNIVEEPSSLSEVNPEELKYIPKGYYLDKNV